MAQSTISLVPTQGARSGIFSPVEHAGPAGSGPRSTNSLGNRSVASEGNSVTNVSVMSIHTLDADVDMDGYSKVDFEVSSVAQVMPSPTLSSYSDVSHYLEGQGEAVDMLGVLGTVSSDTFSRMAPSSDLYGWNAEWDRRTTSPTSAAPSSERITKGQAMPLRRRRTRHKLLGRVFGGGKPPSNSKVRP